MKIVFFSCAAAALLTFLTLPVISNAGEAANYAKDAEFAEGTPPMIPHRIIDTANGEYCLGCHKTGLNGAPLCPHPVRLTCTGCHGQGDIKDSRQLKKGRKR